MNSLENKSRNVLCVLPTLGDTKDSKRIKIIREAGYKVNVCAFERTNFVTRMPDCEVIILGKISDGKYFYRIWIYLISIFKLRRLIKKVDVLYAISPDVAFVTMISALFLNKKLIMDVADIREVEVSKSIAGYFVRLLVKIISNKCSLIVVTSTSFIDNFYNKILKLKNKEFFLLENKVDYSLEFKVSDMNSNDKIKIGYFGVLRDNWTIELLKEIALHSPDKFEIYIAGIDCISKYDLSELGKTISNFHYLGPYKSPDALIDLYDKIDVMSVFYPEYNSDVDWFNAKRICRSNRFYEACYFKKPLIAFEFSEDGSNVEDMDIGFTLESYDIKKSIEKIIFNLTIENLVKWKDNIQNLPDSIYVYTDESLRLRSKIEKLFKL